MNNMNIKIWSASLEGAKSVFILPFEPGTEHEKLPAFCLAMKSGQTIFDSNQQIIFLCLGSTPTLKDVRHLLIQTFKSFQNLISQAEHLIWDLDVWKPDTPVLSSALLAIFCSDYEIGGRKTNGQATDEPVTSSIRYTSHLLNESSLHSHAVIAAAQKEVMDLINGPSNEITPDYLARYAQKSGVNHKFSVKVYDEQDLQKHGFGCITAVNRGSAEPARLIECQIKLNGHKPDHTIAILGKGVTFDTGGVSIKASSNMHYMKSDMGGGAIVLGAMQVLSEMKLPVHIVGLVPATDNVVDAKSIKPGDIVRSYGNKTVEIIDTDAEGRLILADSMEYVIDKHRPELIIDLATLTGSTVRTLGSEAAAIFTKNQDSLNLFIEAAEYTGEKIWPMPLWTEYDEYLHTDIADIRNLSTKPVAGAITAAKFIEFFTNNHPNWIHLDVPASSFDQTPFGKQKAATGYGVHLLVDFIRRYVESLTS